MGCTLAARRAGIQLAHNATIISSAAAPHSVAGSDGVMPNSIDFTNRVTANDAPMPIAIAAADSDEASPSIMFNTYRGSAPRTS